MTHKKKERSIALFDNLFSASRLSNPKPKRKSNTCSYCGNGEMARIDMHLPGGKVKHYKRCLNCGYEE